MRTDVSDFPVSCTATNNLNNDMRDIYSKRIISCLLIILIASLLTRLEIYGFKMKPIMSVIIWLAAGVLMYMISGFLRGSGSAIRKSVLGLAFAVYVLTAPLVVLQFLMCGEGGTGIKYVSLKDDDVFLECRNYDCFQTSSVCELTEVRTVLAGIYWVTNVDEKQVDQTKWKKLSSTIK